MIQLVKPEASELYELPFVSSFIMTLIGGEFNSYTNRS
ncbi:hypothetical protein PPIS_a3313 [Pseudoalteromonas piscicida]|uniref:Uncharacterized protein n=1 Tax=Pseudoalteromonas piscicida TaxID=43662 RepID=A0ABN5CLF6_PSEO7|nr:hypothetical protein PPIS_a3313 [Pseudoalteromonas piscicida]